MQLSLIIPLYNRPDEIRELLESMLTQTNKNFDLVIVEDGSKIDSREIIETYKDRLAITYVYQANTGPALARNRGMQEAKGDYFIFLDSDIIVPEHYIEIVRQQLSQLPIDAFGGPDAAHPSFSTIQKSINYSMTSFFTTGGIRGGKKKMDTFYPRSFNMGISREVYEKTHGFANMRFGEDVDFSYRIVNAGFKTRLIPEAFVYHKRRSTYKQFFKQVFNSGIARINLSKRHPKTLKLVHTLPTVFTMGSMVLIGLSVWKIWFAAPILLHALAVLTDSSLQNKSLNVGLYSVAAAYTQLIGYGLGFLKAFWRRIILKKPEFKAFDKTFYK